MNKHITTIEGLAEMMQRPMTSQEDSETVTVRLDRIDSRLDRSEHLLLAEQKRKIEDVETRMKRLEDALAV
jgi:hypothetical protein